MLPLVAFLWISAAQWVPARWNSSDPASLDLLTGTPINCLVLRHGEPRFVKAAAARGIATLGIVSNAAEVPAAAVPDGFIFVHLPERRHLNFAGTDAITG